MEDGSAVLLAVAKYYSPSGKSIMDDYVTPTVTVTVNEPVPDVEEDDTAATPTAPEPRKDEDDAILKRAIEVLNNGKNSQADNKIAGAPDSTTNLEDQRPKLPPNVRK